MTAVKVGGAGPIPARIMLIGEAPGKSEEEQCKPFVGESGKELSRMLNEAGILRADCYVTNVCKYRPPQNKMDLWWPKKDKNGRQVKTHVRPNMVQYYSDWMDPRVAEGMEELINEVAKVQPNIIVPLGNLPLFALTGRMGITKWRSSLLHTREEYNCAQTKVIPTFHPAAILRKWDWRYLAVHDLRRVARWKDYQDFPNPTERFISRPDIECVRRTLSALLRELELGPKPLAVDIETRRRQIACIGIAWTRADAICIPFLCVERPEGYWDAEQEIEIILLLRQVLTHPNARCIGQNWQYDYQYIAKQWGFEVNLWLDTMSEHHVQFPGLPKGLDFQSSLYRDIHIYWKDESKEWASGLPEDTLWIYNCRDCIATFENAEVLDYNRTHRPLNATAYGSPHEIQQSLSAPMARASARGIRVDHDLRAKTAFMLQEDIRTAEEWVNGLVGFNLNVRSSKQMHQLFYHDFGFRPILDRKTHRPTLDAEALEKIGKIDILVRPLCDGIAHIRSLYNSLAVCLQPLDGDGRFRCQFTIPGTETFRFASSTDPFGYGGNGQNITSGEEEVDGKPSPWPLPNLRKNFIPDPGYVIGEYDLPQADARVVAWEAEDEDLIKLFEDPSRHLHMENAELIFGKRPQSKHEINYYYAKQGVHLTNYGGSPGVLAMTLGITVHEADKFQSRWFSAHPKIRKWHNRVLIQLQTRRFVENRFGFRRFYFDRMEGLLKEALAWIPQSTVAVCTNLGIIACDRDRRLREWGVQLLLQVHDSSVCQWPVLATRSVVPRILELSTITVPYAYPLVLKPEVKVSTKSWGDCEDYKPMKEAA